MQLHSSIDIKSLSLLLGIHVKCIVLVQFTEEDMDMNGGINTPLDDFKVQIFFRHSLIPGYKN